MAGGGLGVTVLPAMAAPLGAAAGLATVPFKGAAAGRTIALAFRPTSTRRAEIEKVAEVLRRRAPAGTAALPA
jgi:DNA-binding transcriptional LysR family regulator